MRQSLKNYKRLVVKIGASLLYSEKAKPAHGLSSGLSSQIASLIKEGKEIVIVSSGAVAFGMAVLKMSLRPKELSYLQAAASIGQHLLMAQYHQAFESKGLNCAQVLLTWDDFNNRQRYLNAKNTLSTLLKLGIVPIINENDTVSTDEIKFGDNDRLSALVAKLVSADILLILSDVDGLLDKAQKVVPVVHEITPEVKTFACPTNKKTCVGGMVTKIEAAKIAMDSGICCVIANGRRKNIILSVIDEPEKNGTLFISKKCLTAKKHWIAFGAKPKGRIIVDEGAKRALLNKKSLLSVGIVEAQGNFDTGDIVSLVDRENCEFARGRANVSGKELEEIKGSRYYKEIVHCDNIVVL